MAHDFVASKVVVVVVVIPTDPSVTTVEDVECALDVDGEPFRFSDVMAAAAARVLFSLLMMMLPSSSVSA